MDHAASTRHKSSSPSREGGGALFATSDGDLALFNGKSRGGSSPSGPIQLPVRRRISAAAPSAINASVAGSGTMVKLKDPPIDSVMISSP